MLLDLLVAEIGSTTTIVNAYQLGDKPVFLGRGFSRTTVETNVVDGIEAATENLRKNLGVEEVTYKKMYATSSAAGGLRVSVHGLVYEMTVKAAKEAALGAGANIHLVTANKISDRELKKIAEINPNMILIAGGTDYGEKETALYNIEKVLELKLDIPVIYAGNVANHEEIKEIFTEYGVDQLLKITENVYPRVDYLNILPLREVIHETFEEHIIHAKGMEHIYEAVTGRVIPTPGSVMEATMLFNEMFGNVLTIDIGGATTDIHSVTEPSKEYSIYQEEQPLIKRTVEGDLGVYVSRKSVVNTMDKEKLGNKLDLSEAELDELIDMTPYIPVTAKEKELIFELTKQCVELAMNRHAGDLKRVFTTGGHKMIPEGKDLTQVEHIILTGGALIHQPGTTQIIRKYLRKYPKKLLPHKNVKIHVDKDYILASIGVLTKSEPEIAKKLLLSTLELEEQSCTQE